MARFLFLLHERPDASEGISPEEMQRIVERYGAWRDEIARRGPAVVGEKLADGEGRTLRRGDGDAVRVIDGPYSETKEVVAGFFAIEAADYDEAVALAESCPHLDYGTVEIRRIDELH